MCVQLPEKVWGLWELDLQMVGSYQVGFRNQTQVIWLGDKKLNPLGHFSSSPSVSCLQQHAHTAGRAAVHGLTLEGLGQGFLCLGSWPHPLCLPSSAFNLSSKPLSLQTLPDQSSLSPPALTPSSLGTEPGPTRFTGVWGVAQNMARHGGTHGARGPGISAVDCMVENIGLFERNPDSKNPDDFQTRKRCPPNLTRNSASFTDTWPM